MVWFNFGNLKSFLNLFNNLLDYFLCDSFGYSILT